MSKRIVVIGAVALGPKAACRAKRLDPDAEVILIDQSDRISYGGCGIPYFVSGEVNRVEDLQTTPYGTIRDAQFFETHKGVKTLTQTKAVSLDRAAKTVTVQHLLTNETQTLPYDKLVLALGSTPNLPPIPGIDLEGISPATNLDEADAIRTAAQSGKISKAVVVGGGFIGLEMAVALADMWGIETSIVEFTDQVMPNFLSSTLSDMVIKDLEANGVNVYCSEAVTEFQGENGKVARVVTTKRTLEADLVIMAAGIRPNTKIASDAGIETTERGLIIVDKYMRTSDPDIYSGGDCACISNLVTGKPGGWFPLGSMANRQGRVIGTNVTGGDQTFQGAVGAFGVKLFEQCAAGAGLTIANALKEGYDAINVHVEQVDKAHFYPEKTLVCLELVVDKASRKVLGIQGMCANGDALAARINPVAALLCRGCTVADISNLEVLYSPPFAAAMDVVNVVGNVAENIIEGRLVPMTQEEFSEIWANIDSDEVFLLDPRASVDATPQVEAFSAVWHNIPQNEIFDRLDEIPKDKPIVIVCNTGLRAYDAQLDLAQKGYKDTRSVMGGLASAKKLGFPHKRPGTA